MTVILSRKGGGGGSAGGLVLLGSQVLAADAASLDITGISQEFETLLISYYTRTSQAVALSNVLMQFNGDAGANYDRQRLQGANATPGATAFAAQTSIDMFAPGATATANTFSAGQVWVPAYARVAGHKATVMMMGWAPDAVADMRGGMNSARWRNTAAITQVTLIGNAGSNIVAGSSMAVYGIG